MFMEKYKGIIFFVLAFGLAGTSVIAARYVVDKLDTFTFISISLFFALILLIPISIGKLKPVIKKMKGIDWLRIFLQSLFGIILFRLFLFSGLRLTSSAEAGVLTGVTPAITVLLAKYCLKESMDKKHIIGIFCTIAGILLIQGLITNANSFTMEHFIGNMLIICAAVFESIFNILSRVSYLKSSSDKSSQMNPLIQTTLVVSAAFVMSFIACIFENPLPLILSLELNGWLALVWYGFFVTALAFIFWYSGIKRCKANVAAVFSSMMPLTGLVLSILILKEVITTQQWIGGFLIIFGMIIIPLKIRKSKHLNNGSLSE